MGYRNLIIENPAKLSLKNQQLMLDNGSTVSIPVEDINAIVFESRQAVVSTALLSFLAQNNVAVYICDEKHMPCAVLEPFSQHSRQAKAVLEQIALSEAKQKGLWNQIVKAKIINQSRCLGFCGKFSDSEELAYLAQTVKNGDETNTEATAAMKYFPALFGEGFRRSDDSDLRNACLNYGYAVLRGCIARYLAAYGFLPCIGIHHCSQLNAFNLADDIIEPYRPIVDLFVAANVAKQTGGLTPDLKRYLFHLLNYNIQICGKQYGLAYATELTIQSFSACCGKKQKELKLPLLVELSLHSYE